MSSASTTPSPADSGPGNTPDTRSRPIPQFALILGGLAAIWVVMLGINAQSSLVGPVFLTINLFVVVYPLQQRLNKRGFPPLIGALVSGLLVAAILIAFFGSLAWATARFIVEIPQYQGQFSLLYSQMIDWLRGMRISEQQVIEQLEDLQRQVSPSNAVAVLQSALSGLTGILSAFAVLLTVIFVGLIDSMSTDRRAAMLLRTKPSLTHALLDFAQGVRRYWIVSTTFGLIVSAMNVAVLLYLDVPLPWVWGLFTFLTNYIPNIGFVMGLVPPAIMALLANDPLTSLIVIITFSVINFVMQSVIQPKFTGDSVGVTASVSLISLLFWSWALGPLGAILALPATLLLKTILIDIDPDLRWLNVLFASDPSNGEPLAGNPERDAKNTDTASVEATAPSRPSERHDAASAQG
ncbi:AI-2E family transporter [Dermatophilus congolensis]|uniref:AI-2E family transporter n=1 Tax=Dermatophilus congolensis TaxID=1863 RepID=UPI000BA30503|nr:AI-2E family transporter [Dermatophilus congolensis]MBO3130277.1 AI-2E family transporter [Dermatophilus congolensis]MBO3131092.1 AI-2E family transporter [Dermatophilus congolensis]MBO3134748.1 AI-2E family transporter [Dermatophilus congolensis]MBO3136984.1 AI-2E family transporter [Dermatophilus congolensis]MBO3139229.1 AI-2E family transporter [Dermatophilus congolensis]